MLYVRLNYQHLSIIQLLVYTQYAVSEKLCSSYNIEYIHIYQSFIAKDMYIQRCIFIFHAHNAHI